MPVGAYREDADACGRVFTKYRIACARDGEIKKCVRMRPQLARMPVFSRVLGKRKHCKWKSKGSEAVRGMSAKSLDLIEQSRRILVEIQPATVRGVCYQLFVRGLKREQRRLNERAVFRD